MAIRKRSYRAKRSRKGMRRSRRMYNISKPRSLFRATPTVSFKRTFWWSNWTPSSATTGGFWRYEYMQMNLLPNWAEYSALFDQYKLNGVKVTYRPRYDNFSGNDTTDTTLPGVTNQAGNYVHIINDPESNITPSGVYSAANLNAFLENGNVRTVPGNKTFSVFFKPRIENTITAGSQRIKAPWLQTKDNTVGHYGYHVFMQDVNLTGTFGQSFDIFVTLYFQCRGQK